MFDQLFNFYFSYINPVIYGLVGLLGLYGGGLLIRRTQSKGPLLIIISSVIKFLVGLAVPISSYLQQWSEVDFDFLRQIWLSLSLIDLIASVLLFVGLILVAKEFRSLIDARKLEQTLENDFTPPT